MAPAATITNAIDKEYCIADLAVINYSKLQRKDPAEAAKLYSACADWGFFYLDLDGDETRDYFQNLAALFAASKAYFAKPIKEKMKDKREEISIYNTCG